MGQTVDTIYDFGQVVLDHLPVKTLVSLATSVLVTAFGPVDIILRAFLMAMAFSLCVLAFRYVQIWLDPDIDTETAVTEHARRWASRWFGFLIIAGMAYQISILMHIPAIREWGMAFAVISESMVMLAVLEAMMGISLDPIRNKLKLFAQLVADKRISKKEHP